MFSFLRAELRIPLDQRSEVGPRSTDKETFAKITLKDEVTEVTINRTVDISISQCCNWTFSSV